MRRSVLFGVIAGILAAVLYRRRGAARGERVDLYYADGSTATLESGEPAAERLLALARDGLAAARG